MNIVVVLQKKSDSVRALVLTLKSTVAGLLQDFFTDKTVIIINGKLHTKKNHQKYHHIGMLDVICLLNTNENLVQRHPLSSK